MLRIGKARESLAVGLQRLARHLIVYTFRLCYIIYDFDRAAEDKVLEIREELRKFAIGTHADFSAKLVPTVERERILGVKIPVLKTLAKEAVKSGEYSEFLNAEHYYLEEFILHGLILGTAKFGYDELIGRIEAFLPEIDNWQVCDATVGALKAVKKFKEPFYDKCKEWLKSDKEYTVRFAVVTLLSYYLGEGFNTEIPEALAAMESDKFYVNMAVAWYFSFALIKRYDETIGIFESGAIKNVWVHNKSVQKSLESYRISSDKKNYLKTLKRKA